MYSERKGRLLLTHCGDRMRTAAVPPRGVLIDKHRDAVRVAALHAKTGGRGERAMSQAAQFGFGYWCATNEGHNPGSQGLRPIVDVRPAAHSCDANLAAQTPSGKHRTGKQNRPA